MQAVRNSWTAATCGLLVTMLLAQSAPAAGANVPTGKLALRAPHRPPENTLLRPWHSSERIVVKFAEGSGVRIRNGRLLSLAGRDMAQLNRVLAAAGLIGAAVQPLLDRPEAIIAAEKSRAEQRSGKQLADLNLYFFIQLRQQQNAAIICDALNELNIVEVAFPQPLPAPSPAAGASTPDFSSQQGYALQLAGGIGIDRVVDINGIDGANVTFADIEYDWELDHEDLQLPAAINTDPETIFDPYPPANHGTAVLGILVGKDNGFGVTGLVPAASPLVFPTATERFKYNPGRAINRAAASLQPGDVMLLEIQTWVCGTGEYGPAEWSPVVFDVVENATALGIVVVAPAGNGNVDLDQPACGGLFDRTVRDSGAIIVGAGLAGANTKTSFSSYGSRVDVQAWGDWSVVTAGYGDLFDPLQGDLRRRYTNSFSGTSSATPIVAGAAIALQGALRAAGAAALDSFSMRQLLRRTGTPQMAGEWAGSIGPMPNVPAALADLFGWYAVEVNPQIPLAYVDTDLPDESVSVAVLSGSAAGHGYAGFDLAQLDSASIRFGSGRAVPLTPAGFADLDGDGDIDATLQFATSATGIACEDTSAALSGATYSGFPMQREATITTPACPGDLPCHP